MTKQKKDFITLNDSKIFKGKYRLCKWNWNGHHSNTTITILFDDLDFFEARQKQREINN